MKHEMKLASAGLGAVLALATASTEAKAPPASLQEMWKIIQQQQKEIEALKAKAGENEALKQEVKALKEGAAEPAVGAATVGNGAADAKLHVPKSETERKTDILATEVEKLKTQLFIPDKREYKSEYGFGPAASQVYRVKSGLSIGGYGEAVYTNYTANKTSSDYADMYRAVLYVGYKFNDWIILNNEFEFEHGTTGRNGGTVSVEFSQLDFMLHKNANIRAGLVLMPMGFINEIHEPTTFHGNSRPDVERFIIPSTWRELGAGLFGEIVPGLDYRMYAVTGMDAGSFSSAGIRGGRQSGGNVRADDWAFTGRLDYNPDFAPGVIMGASAYLGDSGQDRLYGGQRVGVFTQLYEGHIQWHYKGLEMRALGAFGDIGNAAQVSKRNGSTVGSENYGWYTEAAYDVMPLVWSDTTQYLAPFFRYERYNTQASVPSGFVADKTWDRWIYQTGLTYKPIQNIAVKADYRNIHSGAGGRPHEFNLGIGFIY